MLEHGLLDLPQATHLLSHLHLGVAVGLQDGLGHIAQEMVPAIAMRDPGNSAAIPFTKASCLSETQSTTVLPSDVGPLLGLGDQPSHFVAPSRRSSGSANQTRFWVSSRTT